MPAASPFPAHHGGTSPWGPHPLVLSWERHSHSSGPTHWNPPRNCVASSSEPMSSSTSTRLHSSKQQVDVALESTCYKCCKRFTCMLQMSYGCCKTRLRCCICCDCKRLF
ncbi:hypothetical protein SORBI_3005G077633 [Sorghum bicolor]|uniref:Uncharacterized protein n=1 Tax=Sorghum bicolor TaxID=4558 RepID=A0A1Z5RI44_SORBI|nr:hypothetical protein SORBI_3005G077633 [Sorghum bicolor]OQU83105.1 hypothetical protein SORBI_3005G077633 [Sorghum bicolor]